MEFFRKKIKKKTFEKFVIQGDISVTKKHK